MRLGSSLPYGLGLVAAVIALSLPLSSLAAQRSSDVPAWLDAHVGEGDGQIARTVLERARALYLRKVSQGVVRNPCYFAMDATRPADLGNGEMGRRFYTICEGTGRFARFRRAMAAGAI